MHMRNSATKSISRTQPKMNDNAFAETAVETMPVDQKTTDLNCHSYDDKENVKQPNDRELAVEIGEHYQVKRSDSTWRTYNPHFIAQSRSNSNSSKMGATCRQICQYDMSINIVV